VAVFSGGVPVPVAGVLLSPKLSDHEAIVPSLSELVEPWKVTLSGAVPVAGDGDDVRCAVGARFAFAVTATVTGSLAPSLSVTVSVAVQCPTA
jgi:hypothetical protein